MRRRTRQRAHTLAALLLAMVVVARGLLAGTPAAEATERESAALPSGRVLATTDDGAKFSAADPALVRDGDVWRLFTTKDEHSPWSHVPVWESTDLVTWTLTGEALPERPGWSGPFRTWAPDAIELDGRWILFFSAVHAERDLMCIGHAVASTAVGPYRPYEEPIVCELDEGGSIDPMVHVDGAGDPWLLWKTDANAIGSDSSLRSQRLSGDGTRLLGERSTLLTIAHAWESPLIEQPEMIEVDGTLHLFYAGGWYNQPTYAVGHATCETPAGPCARTTVDGGWLAAEGRIEGPGALSIESIDGQLIGVYHAWIDGISDDEYRSLVVQPINIRDGGPVARDGTFVDDHGSRFEGDIEWLSASGITRGCGVDRFCPDRAVSRGEMAAFLHRALRAALAVGGLPVGFVDDDGSRFEGDGGEMAHTAIS